MTKTPLGVVLPITTQSAARESQKSQSDNKNFSSPKGEGFQPSPSGTLKWDPWQFLKQLRAKNLHLNVEIEDWLDAAEFSS